jgi:FkbM family methyltransferase
VNFSKLARTVVERSTRNWVYTRRLPRDFAGVPIVVTPAAGLKYIFKSMSNIDPPLLRGARELVRPGDVVWDIGANVGLFAFAAAHLAGPKGTVVAFEPDAWLVQILRRSAARQPASSANVSIVPAAVASDVSLRSFTISSRSRASNAMSEYGRSQMGRASERQTIVALSLAWCATWLPHPNVIKCDVEGAELEVFLDQPVIFKDIRPVILCEVGSQTQGQLTDLFVRARYRLYDGEKPLISSPEVNQACWSTIAIPEELRHHYIGGPST